MTIIFGSKNSYGNHNRQSLRPAATIRTGRCTGAVVEPRWRIFSSNDGHGGAPAIRRNAPRHCQAAWVPRPLHLDQTCDNFDQPVLVLEYVEGTTSIEPGDAEAAMPRMAEMLARIHNIDPIVHDLKFLPSEEERNNKRVAQPPEKLDDILQEGRVRAILEAEWPPASRNPDTLLHGDFWTGNLLWQNGEIVAVIDWENALIGDPAEDLANARMEIFWRFGLEAMNHFTAEYQSMSNADLSQLPYLDLLASLRPMGRIASWVNTKEEEETLIKGHSGFVEQAMRSLG